MIQTKVNQLKKLVFGKSDGSVIDLTLEKGKGMLSKAKTKLGIVKDLVLVWK